MVETADTQLIARVEGALRARGITTQAWCAALGVGRTIWYRWRSGVCAIQPPTRVLLRLLDRDPSRIYEVMELHAEGVDHG